MVIQAPTKSLNVFQGLFSRIFLAVIAWGFVVLTSCTPKNQKEAKTAEPISGKAREVNLAIWANYLKPEQQKAFTEKTGIKLNITHFTSNEELLAKIQSGASGIDVAIPSDYMVKVMTKLQLLENLGAFKEELKKEIDGNFLNLSFDPENKFSLPYAWSYTGIAYHKDFFSGDIKSWKDVLTRKDLDNKFSLLDDSREVLALGLKAMGFSLNSKEAKELKQAKDFLLQLKKKVKMFRSETIDALVKKEVALAQCYSLDALQANELSGGKIGFISPAEGAPVNIDNLVIVKGSKNISESEELIKFILSFENNVAFVQRIYAGPVLKKTKSALPQELQKNPILYPDSKIINKLERLEDIGEMTKAYDEAWTEIKSQ